MTRLERTKPEHLQRLESFLADNSLPIIGLRDCYQNFFIAVDERGSWCGVAGYELYDQSALLRSVAVSENMRGQGCGRILVEAVLEDTKKRGVHAIYLLTDTAEGYFTRHGFKPISRGTIPQEVKRSPEFSECCASAQAMLKMI